MTLPLLARSGCRRQLATQTLLRSVRAVLYLLAMVTLPAHARSGYTEPAAAAAAPQSRRAEDSGERAFRSQDDAAARPTPLDRLIWRRLSCGCCRTPDQRPDLASNAKIAQSLLGKSELGGLY
jgi:hypothetical protein